MAAWIKYWREKVEHKETTFFLPNRQKFSGGTLGSGTCPGNMALGFNASIFILTSSLPSVIVQSHLFYQLPKEVALAGAQSLKKFTLLVQDLKHLGYCSFFELLVVYLIFASMQRKFNEPGN